MARLPTGIEELDSLLYGGIPDNYLLLLRGYPGCGFIQFAQQFVCHGLNRGANGIYFTSRRSVSDIIENMKFLEPNIESFLGKNLTFIDAYTPRLKEFASQQDIDVDSGVKDELAWSMGPMEMLNIFFTTDLKNFKGEIRGVIDSLSFLLRENSLEDVVSLLEKIQFASTIYGGVYILLLIEDIHDAKTIATISDIADGVIQFFEKEKGTVVEPQLRFLKMEKTDYNTRIIPYALVRSGISYRISVRGIEIESTRRIL